MKITLYIISIILGLTSLTIGQNDLLKCFENPYELDISKQYDWVTSFNDEIFFSNIIRKNLKTHKLDSVVSKRFDWQFGGFDWVKSGLIIEDSRDISYSYEKKDSDDWTPISFTLNNFNENNQIETTSFNAWDGDLNNFQDYNPLILTTYYYNSNNQLKELHQQNQNQIENKLLGNVFIFEYNSESLLESLTFKRWSSQEDSLVLLKKSFYEYNGYGSLDLLLEFENDIHRGYFASDSIIYEYQPDELLEEEVQFVKSALSDDWLLSKKVKINYDNQNKIEKEVIRTQFSDTIARNVDTLFYRYYPYGSLSDIIGVDTDSSHLETVGFVFTVKRQGWEQVHDSNIQSDKILRGRLYQPRYEENHMITEYIESLNIGLGTDYEGSLTDVFTINYYYSEIKSTSIENVNEDHLGFSLSPNPTHDFIEINSTENQTRIFNVQLISIDGQQVLDRSTYGKEPLDISHLDNGIYFYIIDNNQTKSIGTLVVI